MNGKGIQTLYRCSKETLNMDIPSPEFKLLPELKFCLLQEAYLEKSYVRSTLQIRTLYHLYQSWIPLSCAN